MNRRGGSSTDILGDPEDTDMLAAAHRVPSDDDDGEDEDEDADEDEENELEEELEEDDEEAEYTPEYLAELEAQAGLTGQTEHLDLNQRLELLSKCNIKLTKPRAQRRPPIGGKWTTEEDEELRRVVSEHGPRNWKRVAELLGDTRTDVQCLHRWNKVLKPGLHKGPWMEYEDAIVRDMVLRHGVGKVKWSSIAAQLPGRIGKQCRERWFNHLDPAIKKGDWTLLEDQTLYEAQRQFGNRWCEIAKLLVGRTENAVKNRWNSSTMKKWLKDNNLEVGPAYGPNSVNLVAAAAADGEEGDGETAATAAGGRGGGRRSNSRAKNGSSKSGNGSSSANGATQASAAAAEIASMGVSSSSSSNSSSSNGGAVGAGGGGLFKKLPAHLRPPMIQTGAGGAGAEGAEGEDAAASIAAANSAINSILNIGPQTSTHLMELLSSTFGSPAGGSGLGSGSLGGTFNLGSGSGGRDGDQQLSSLLGLDLQNGSGSTRANGSSSGARFGGIAIQQSLSADNLCAAGDDSHAGESRSNASSSAATQGEAITPFSPLVLDAGGMRRRGFGRQQQQAEVEAGADGAPHLPPPSYEGIGMDGAGPVWGQPAQIPGGEGAAAKGKGSAVKERKGGRGKKQAAEAAEAVGGKRGRAGSSAGKDAAAQQRSPPLEASATKRRRGAAAGGLSTDHQSEEGKQPAAAPLGPVDKAVSFVRYKLGLLRPSGTATNETLEPGDVPLELLPFFNILTYPAQSMLVRQLMEKFQRTSLTPRGNVMGSLAAATPRITYGAAGPGYGGVPPPLSTTHHGSSNGPSTTTHLQELKEILGIGTPSHGSGSGSSSVRNSFGGGGMGFDPHCFEDANDDQMSMPPPPAAEPPAVVGEGKRGRKGAAAAAAPPASSSPPTQENQQHFDQQFGDSPRLGALSLPVVDHMDEDDDPALQAAVLITYQVASKSASIDELLQIFGAPPVGGTTPAPLLGAPDGGVSSFPPTPNANGQNQRANERELEHAALGAEGRSGVAPGSSTAAGRRKTRASSTTSTDSHASSEFDDASGSAGGSGGAMVLMSSLQRGNSKRSPVPLGNSHRPAEPHRLNGVMSTTAIRSPSHAEAAWAGGNVRGGIPLSLGAPDFSGGAGGDAHGSTSPSIRVESSFKKKSPKAAGASLSPMASAAAAAPVTRAKS